jgi:cysteine desulfurase family protein (TIGR01976 family)
MQPTLVASVEEIRTHFPALTRAHKGRPVAYFDGPGGTQVPRSVVDAMADYLLNHNANTHWAYETSRETDAILADSRQALADFLNATPDEIVFGQNMTTLTLHLARALGREWQAGDEIIVTDLDHHANIDTWRSLETERGLVFRYLPFDPETGLLELDKLPALFNEKTKLLAIGAASNALGAMSDVTRACRMAHDAGALAFVDAVHYAPHNLVDAQAIGCDFLACSAYKFYGPHVGILFGRKTLLERLDFPKLRPAPSYAPEKAETGTQSHESIAGAAAAVNFLASLSDAGTRRERLAATFAALHERQHELTARLWQGLHEISGVRVYGPSPDFPRTSTISFTLNHLDSQTVVERLSEEGLFLSNGDFYAATVVEKLGLDAGGLVRAGCACYTTPEEIERLLAEVKRLAGSS